MANKKLIKTRQEEIKNLHWLWQHIQELDLKAETMSEIQAKISSRIAQCEISIRDHSKER